MRRRLIGLTAALALALALTGCRATEITTELSTVELGELVIQAQPEDFWPEMAAEMKGSAGFDSYLSDVYGLEPDTCVGGDLAYAASGVQAAELAVLQFAKEEDAASAEEALRDYLVNRQAAFTGYAPEEAALLENALVDRQGAWVLLAVCPNTEEARAAFEGSFTRTEVRPSPTPRPIPTPDELGRIPCDPPGTMDMTAYDTGPVAEAYRTGDESSLTEEDRAILEVCRQAIEEAVTSDMSPFEQELAVHDWIVDWAENGDAETGHASDPYGLLVERKAICMGYSNTFQLFMDLLGIECITVVGASFESRSDHAWNQVKLDGDWYAVDLTWDDPMGSYEDIPAAGEPGHHRYFNVTGGFLLESDHQWDYDAVPEAEGTRYAWPG